MAQDQIANQAESYTSPQKQGGNERPSGWLQVGVVAVASALAGGLAAAWYYRKTLARLRQAEANPQSDESGVPTDPSAEDE